MQVIPSSYVAFNRASKIAVWREESLAGRGTASIQKLTVAPLVAPKSISGGVYARYMRTWVDKNDSTVTTRLSAGMT